MTNDIVILSFGTPHLFKKNVKHENIVSIDNAAVKNALGYIHLLKKTLTNIENFSLCLVTNDLYIAPKGESIQSDYLNVKDSSKIIFAGNHNFNFTTKSLFYFYWKHYPRVKGVKEDYLDTRSFMGGKEKILSLLEYLENKYDHSILEKVSFQEIMSIDYVEGYRVRDLDYNVDLDHSVFRSKSLSVGKDGKVKIFKLLKDEKKRKLSNIKSF